MGHEVTGHYASWNYFQSLKTATNPKFIERWKAYPGSSGVTSDPMEAAYISLYLYKALVEAAGSFDVDDGERRRCGRRHHRSTRRRASSRSTARTTTSPSRATSAGSTPTTSSTSSGPPTSFIDPDPFLEGYDWFPADIRDRSGSRRGLIAPLDAGFRVACGTEPRAPEPPPALPPPHREREHVDALIPPLLNGTAQGALLLLAALGLIAHLRPDGRDQHGPRRVPHGRRLHRLPDPAGHRPPATSRSWWRCRSRSSSPACSASCWRSASSSGCTAGRWTPCWSRSVSA